MENVLNCEDFCYEGDNLLKISKSGKCELKRDGYNKDGHCRENHAVFESMYISGQESPLYQADKSHEIINSKNRLIHVVSDEDFSYLKKQPNHKIKNVILNTRFGQMCGIEILSNIILATSESEVYKCGCYEIIMSDDGFENAVVERCENSSFKIHRTPKKLRRGTYADRNIHAADAKTESRLSKNQRAQLYQEEIQRILAQVCSEKIELWATDECNYLYPFEYTNVCLMPDEDYENLIMEAQKLYLRPKVKHIIFTNKGQRTVVYGRYIREYSQFILPVKSCRGKDINSRQNFFGLSAGKYKHSNRFSDVLEIISDASVVQSLLKAGPQDSTKKKCMLCKLEVLKKQDAPINIYASKEEIERDYISDELRPSQNTITNHGVSCTLYGYYTVDKCFCCTVSEISKNKNRLNGSSAQFILCGSVKADDLVGWLRRNIVQRPKIGRDAVGYCKENLNISYDLGKGQKILLSKTKCHCLKCGKFFESDTMVNCTALVATCYGTNVPVTVYCCKGCGNFYMNYETFLAYNREYKGLLFECYFDGQFNDKNNFFGFAPDSILSRCGYSVRADVGVSRRRAVLNYILDTKKATKYEISELIGHFININKKRPTMQNAVSRWNDDLLYVSNYNISLQKNVGHKSFQLKEPSST